jgi:hypothetical protein
VGAREAAVVPVDAAPGRGGGGREPAVQAVAVLMGAVVALCFLFAFGNVWALGIRLGVPAHIALFVAPAVDMSVIALFSCTWPR